MALFPVSSLSEHPDLLERGCDWEDSLKIVLRQIKELLRSEEIRCVYDDN